MAIKISIVRAIGRHKPLIAALEFATDFKRLSIHDTAEEALREIPKLKPDVLLVDVKLPCLDGFECVDRLTRQMPGLASLMLTTDDGIENDLAFCAVHVGASGCLPDSLPVTDWADAIKHVHAGARRGQRRVVMFFNSDRRLAKAARHWSKMAALIGARGSSIRFGLKWRRVTITGKKRMKPTCMSTMVPPLPANVGNVVFIQTSAPLLQVASV